MAAPCLLHNFISGSKLINFYLLILLISVFNSIAYQLKDVVIPQLPSGQQHRIFDAEELAKYVGIDSESETNKKLVYVAVKGIVFDCTAGTKFYGPSGSYAALAGKDASRAIALWSLDEDDLTSNLNSLDGDTLENFEDIFESVYKKKYPIVGYTREFYDKNIDKFVKRDEL